MGQPQELEQAAVARRSGKEVDRKGEEDEEEEEEDGEDDEDDEDYQREVLRILAKRKLGAGGGPKDDGCGPSQPPTKKPHLSF